MKRVMASALWAVLAWSGCSDDTGVPDSGCAGTVSVSILNYSSLPASGPGLMSPGSGTATTTTGCPAPGCLLEYFQATLIPSSGPSVGQSLISTTAEGTPPLVVPSVTMPLGSAYMPGDYDINLIAADGYSASTGNISSVAYVGRISSTSPNGDLTDACPSPLITMAPPTSLDVCLDGCAAQLRCGSLSHADFLTCQAGSPTGMMSTTFGCTASATALTGEQTAWVNNMAAALAMKFPMKYANAAAAMGDAMPLVQQAINAYEACNFQACNMIASCAASALAALTNPMPM